VSNRRFTTVVISVILLWAGFVTANAAQRLVLAEGFTQWNCGPCASWNPTESNLVDGFGRDTLIAIKYHVSWPQPNNDAFYLWNTAEVNARITHYGVRGVPYVMIDGLTEGSPIDLPPFTETRQLWLDQVRARYDTPAPCSICLLATPGANGAQLNYVGTVSAEEDIWGAKLFVVLITDRVSYLAAPGANGERSFPDIFRDVSPSTLGEAVTVPADGKYFFSGTLRKDSTVGTWDLSNLSIVAFLQGSDNEILQAAWNPAADNDFAFSAACTEAAQALCDPNGGERLYSVKLKNTGNSADTYHVSLTGEIPAGWTTAMESDGGAGTPGPLAVVVDPRDSVTVRVHLNPNAARGTADFALSATSDNLPECISWQKQFRLMAGPEILLVDDDGGAGVGNYEYYYTAALQDVAPNLTVARWDMALGALDGASLGLAPVTVWFTGNSAAGSTISSGERNLLMSYLNGGGRLFLTGQGIAQDLGNTTFLSQYLHASYVQQYAAGHDISGVAGQAVGEGLSFSIEGGDGGQNQFRQSAINAATDGAGTVNLEYTGSAYHAGVVSQTQVYKTVFLGFGFEAINNVASRDSVMAQAIRWLGSPVSADPRPEVTPGEFALNQNYPNPFNPSTAIEYSLPMKADVSLRIYDLLGREVAALTTGSQEAGTHVAHWNAAGIASGLYFYRLDASTGAQSWHATRKLMLLK
jgi:hypothetical protein